VRGGVAVVVEDNVNEETNAQTQLDLYRDRMGFNPPNRTKLELAFEYAHRIREFEIGLYWTRTNYFWGFQVAFFAALGLLAEAGMAAGAKGGKLIWLISCVAALCLVAAIFCYLWQLMLKGAKFWQENWERHVDAMEDELTGPLYKTYFVPSNYALDERPYSVTQVNRAIVWLIFAFWGLLFIITSAYLIHLVTEWKIPNLNFGVYIIVGLLIVLLGFSVFSGRSLRMKNLGDRVPNSSCTTHHLVQRETLKNHEGS
jgi:hypothetical protein